MSAIVCGWLRPVNGVSGMTMGSQFYPDNANGTQFHIVVLDRNTLEGIRNYNLPVTSSGVAQMATDFSALTSTDPVFVALPPTAGVISDGGLISQLDSTLRMIGGIRSGTPGSLWLLPAVAWGDLAAAIMENSSSAAAGSGSPVDQVQSMLNVGQKPRGLYIVSRPYAFSCNGA
jgi:hypothetical protein